MIVPCIKQVWNIMCICAIENKTLKMFPFMLGTNKPP